MFENVILPPGAGLRVEVPCSTSNLGPGFDLLGLALELRLEVEFRPTPGRDGLRLELGAGAAGVWPRSPDNLLLRGFERAWRAAGGGSPAGEFHVVSAIPVARGLGSSGAAIVAGLLLGATCAPRAVERDELLAWALELEGHPDNVAPALFGGCVLAVPRAGAAPRIVRQELHPSLGFALAWPATTLETSFARRLLPAQVAFADALENPRRLALLLEGLRSGDAELLRLGEHDRLHVPHRLPHIPGGAAALDAAHAAGAWLATISGSGSALFAIAPHARAEAVARAMRSVFERAAGPAGGRAVRAALRAPRPSVVP